jgi:hypothetical protein
MNFPGSSCPSRNPVHKTIRVHSWFQNEVYELFRLKVQQSGFDFRCRSSYDLGNPIPGPPPARENSIISAECRYIGRLIKGRSVGYPPLARGQGGGQPEEVPAISDCEPSPVSH